MASPLTAVVFTPALTSSVHCHCSPDPPTVVVSDQGKERTFHPSLCLNSTDIAGISRTILEALDWTEPNIGFVTYGPRGSGKSSLVFEEGGLVDILLDYLVSEETVLGVSMSEVVYSDAHNTEVWRDLLNPDNSAQFQIHAQIQSFAEAKAVIALAQSHSETWNSGQLHSNRGHLLLDLALLSTSHHIFILDLAGFQPTQLSPDLHSSLPSSQHLMFTRMGLLQLRSYCRQLSEGKERDASHRFKVISMLERVLTADQLVFLICLREDSMYGDACNALELVEVVEKLPRLEVELPQVSTRPFREFFPEESSEKVIESPLKSFQTNQTILSQSKEDDDTQDWLSAYDARLSLLLARSTSKPQSLTSPEPSHYSEDVTDTEELKSLRDACDAMRKSKMENEEETKALERVIVGLETELDTVRAETEGKIGEMRRENEAMASAVEDLSTVKGAEKVSDIYQPDLSVLETELDRVSEQLSLVRWLCESDPADKQQIRQLKELMNALNVEMQREENEKKSLQQSAKKWEMAEKCYNNVKLHVRSLEGELTSLESKLSKQESKSQRLLHELQQERVKTAELTKRKTHAKEETAKLTLASAHHRRVAVIKASPSASVSTNAGIGSIVKDIRELQDGLRRSGAVSQLPVAGQLLEQATMLTDELRKGKIRMKNLAAKILKLKPGQKTPKTKSYQTSANSSFSRLPKFSFS